MTPQALAETLGNAQQKGGSWYGLCPVHADTEPSCKIDGSDDGKTLVWNCKAGCDQEALTAAVLPLLRDGAPQTTRPRAAPPASSPAPKKPKAKLGTEEAAYDYTDAAGKLLFQVVRFRDPKSFLQRKPDPGNSGKWLWKLGNVPKVLYRLPRVIENKMIFVVEGEKDVIALESVGLTATCNPGGSGAWLKIHTEALRGKRVAIIADHDELERPDKTAGRDHANKVAAALEGVSEIVKVFRPPEPHKDAADWIEAGATKAEVVARAKATLGTRLEVPDAHIAITAAAPTPERATEWPHGLRGTQKSGPYAISGNAIYAMREAPGLKDTLSLDTFTQELTVVKELPWGTRPGARWSDRDDGLFAKWLQWEGIRVSSKVAREAANIVGGDLEHDSLQDYLRGLAWDGTPRLLTVATMFGAGSEEECQLVRMWMISAVARAMKPGCKADHVLVLEGEQGVGKSTGLKALFDPDERGWFRRSMPAMGSKDSFIHLAGAWCIELAELASVNSRWAELDKVKAFITDESDTYRPLWSGRGITVPRRTVFAGSTNAAQWARDPTGGRRWLPVACHGTIDVQGLADDHANLWAEAVLAYDQGEHWWLDDDSPLLQHLKVEQESRRIAHPWEEVVLRYAESRDAITQEEIFNDVLKMPLERRGQRELNTVGQILVASGKTSQRIRGLGNGGLTYVYALPHMSPEDIRRYLAQAPQRVITEEQAQTSWTDMDDGSEGMPS